MAERIEAVEEQAVRDASASYLAEAEIATAEDVPPGYKRTEVGVIPEDWNICRIDEHASISTGEKNTQDKIDGGRYPFFVRSQNVERINTFSFDGEAVLTAGDGVGTGKIFHYINGQFDVHQRVYRITHFSQSMNGRYFFYQFSSRFYDRIMAMTAKSSVDSVRREMIAGMPIPLPQVREQHAIATALSDADAMIESLDRLVAKKRAIKQAAMQQLLTGQTRLPGFTDEGKTKRLGKAMTVATEEVPPGYKRTEVGMIPEDWEVKKLGELYEIKSSKRVLQKDWERFGVPFYRTREIAVLADAGNVDNELFVSEELYEEYSKKYGAPKPDDILITGIGTIGKVYIVQDERPFYFKDASVLWLKTRGVLDPVFLKNLFETPLLETQLGNSSTGTTVDTYTISGAKSTVVVVPTLREQRAIATVLADMDTEIEALERRRDKSRQIKQGMMQQLLTGRVRLLAPHTKESAAC